MEHINPRDGEEPCRLPIEEAVDGILLGSADGTVIQVNSQAELLTGYPREELLGRAIDLIFPPDVLEAVPLRYDLLLEGRRVVAERELLRRDGTRLAIEMNTKRMPDGTYQTFLRDISLRRKAQEALLASEERYRLIFAHAPFAIFHFDVQGLLQDCNPAFVELLGSTREALEGFDMLRSVRNPGVLLAIREALQGRSGFYEGEYQPVTGHRRTVIRMFTYQIVSGRGVPLGGIGVVEDLKNRQEAEASYRGLFESVQEGIYIQDREGRFLDINGGALAMYGYPKAFLIGKTPAAVAAPGLNDLEEVGRMHARAFLGEPQSFEFWGRRADGEVFPKDVRLYAGTYFGQEVVIALAQDISERKRAEQALRESEDQLRGLFQNTTDAMFWIRVDPDGAFRVEDVNPAQEASLGMPRKAILGRRLQDFLPAAAAEAVASRYRACILRGRPTAYEETTGMEGDSRTFQTLLIPIMDGQRHIFRLVGSARDITQDKKAEEALRQAQKLESLGVLAGGIAHDFNNLLTAILGNLDLAQVHGEEGSEALPFLEKARKTVLMASDLTQQMLAYSGKGRFMIRPQDLNQVVLDLMDLLHVSISKKVRLSLELAPRLPALEADEAQLHQVVMNLVMNASEAIGDREGSIRIATREQILGPEEPLISFAERGPVPGPHVVLEVTDDGCGMSPEIQERIFDPFFTTKMSGRGLGLSAMLGILRGHHAGIRIDSRPGAGSRFALFFPAAREIPRQEEPPLREAPQDRDGGPWNILLVDDEAEVLETVHEILEILGYRVRTAVDGLDALDLVGADIPVDLVLMDLTMPRMDGREAFKALQSLRPGLPVILYSGYTEQESLQDFQRGGPAAFIQKPFRMQDLRRTLDRVLAQGGPGAAAPSRVAP